MSLDIYRTGKYVEVTVAFGDRLGVEYFARVSWTCPWCHETKEWETADEEALAQLTAWVEGKTSNELVQDALPALPAGIREVFISGICPECWHKAFNDVDGWMVSAREDEDLPF